MQYSPKLKMAMSEIKAIIKKHDIGALVVLHTPGHGEYYKQLEPSYSCMKYEGAGRVRFRAKAEDFGGDKAKRNKVQADTANMLNILSTVCGQQLMQIIELSKICDKIVDAEHGDGNPSSHEQQNN